MNTILEQFAKTCVPGHKGLVVGSREDMIQRTLKQSGLPPTVIKKRWDPNKMTYITKQYDSEGKPIGLKNKMSP